MTRSATLAAARPRPPDASRINRSARHLSIGGSALMLSAAALLLLGSLALALTTPVQLPSWRRCASRRPRKPSTIVAPGGIPAARSDTGS